jgi:hypothetical protein
MWRRIDRRDAVYANWTGGAPSPSSPWYTMTWEAAERPALVNVHDAWKGWYPTSRAHAGPGWTPSASLRHKTHINASANHVGETSIEEVGQHADLVTRFAKSGPWDRMLRGYAQFVWISLWTDARSHGWTGRCRQRSNFGQCAIAHSRFHAVSPPKRLSAERMRSVTHRTRLHGRNMTTPWPRKFGHVYKRNNCYIFPNSRSISDETTQTTPPTFASVWTVKGPGFYVTSIAFSRHHRLHRVAWRRGGHEPVHGLNRESRRRSRLYDRHDLHDG